MKLNIIKPTTLKRLYRAIMAFNLIVVLLVAAVMLQNSIIQVKADDTNYVTVNTHDIQFGTVFPGEVFSQELVVYYVATGTVDTVPYLVFQRPKTGLGDLCPYLTKVSYEGEGETEGATSSVTTLSDFSDRWQIEFAVPAILGNVAQDHEGNFITESGEYGCEIVIEVDDAVDPLMASPESTTGSSRGNSTLFATNKPGDGGIVVMGESSTPNLVISKMYTGSGPIRPGDKNITFNIIITNNGNFTTFDTVLHDTLPTGLTYSDSGQVSNYWPLGDLEPGEIKQVSYTVDADNDIQSGDYINEVSATAANHDTITAQAKIEVGEKPTVMGISQEFLEETGFETSELIWLLVLIASLHTVAYILRVKVKREYTKTQNK